MKKHHYLFLLCTGIFMLCSRCTRTDLSQDTTAISVHTLTHEWLNSRIKEGETERNERIELIRQNVLPSRAFAETLEDGEKLIIVPIAAGFTMNHNRDKNADHYLLLFENKNKKVYKGNIVQFIPLNAQQRTLPGNTLSCLWNCKNVSANGTFTVLTIFDKHLYEVDFKDGFKTRYAEMKKGAQKQKRDGLAETVSSTITCIDWYRETTYYFSDGSSYTTEDYLTTTCHSYCSLLEECEARNTLEPDGGAAEPDEEVEKMKTLTWHVYNPSGPLNDTAIGFGVNSIETVKYKKNAGHDGGGYFTFMEHYASACNDRNAFYLEEEGKTTKTFRTVASTVKGDYTKNTITHKISGSKAWTIEEIIN